MDGMKYQLSCCVVTAKMCDFRVKTSVFSYFLMILRVNTKSPFVIRWCYGVILIFRVETRFMVIFKG
jgi:hypothetical protein